MAAPKGNKFAVGAGGGRPSGYKPEYAKMLEDYFNVPAQVIDEDEDGKKIKPSSLPTLAGFACKIGVHRETLLNWAENHQDFFDAFKMAKEHQERILVENGLMGYYDKTFAIFTAKNLINWRDKQEVEHGMSESLLDLVTKSMKGE